MDKFTKLTGVAAPLPMLNVDTDMIIPKQYLKTIRRTGLGQYLFDEMRRTPEGELIGDFVLNRAPYTGASILVAGANFGCGSSREHAQWALNDFGIRCIVAPSFADIFYNNCFQNGMLPVVLPETDVEALMDAAESGGNHTFTVDLEAQTIAYAGGSLSFEIDPERKRRLLNSLDNIDLTLGKVAAIDSFEAAQRAAQPWLYG